MPSFLGNSLDIAREAGALLRNYFERRVGFELKGEYDLVTEADRASERLMVDRLRPFPTHDIVAEEGGGHLSGAEYRWYVDPLDGTTNFAHGFPVYNVTLALERAGEMIAGVIFDPTRDEMFAAERGSGATLNGERIRVSAVSGWRIRWCHRFPEPQASSERQHPLLLSAGDDDPRRSPGRCGGARSGVCRCGRLDAFWEFGLKPWDMAAGILMVEEAGGRCSDMKGKPASLQGPHILADNGHIHEEIRGPVW